MSYELTGYLYKKFDTEIKKDNFQIRTFVIKTEGEYPQFIPLQLSNDKCSLIDQIHEGWKVKAFFNLKGREWEGKFFPSLAAWKVTVEGMTTASGVTHQTPVNDTGIENAHIVPDGDDTPVPF